MEALKTIWDFFQNEVLGMNWLNRLIETILNACGLDTTGKIGASIQFFIYDTIKIMVLLGVLILIISYIQSYFPPERAKKILGRFHGIWANIIAALLGTVTPFCSCSSIPLFIGFTSAGLPLGVTFSFLISSPMVDLGSLVLLMSMQLNSITIMDLIAYGGAALGVVLSTTQFAAGKVDLAGCLLIILLSADFFIPMRQLGSFFHIAMNGMAASDKIFRLLDLPEAEAGTEDFPVGKEIRMEEVLFAYEADREILHGVTMGFPSGSFTAIVGESGSGKSTIGGILMGRNRGYTGKVLVGETPLERIREESLLKNVTYVGHQSYLFKGTVAENLRLAAPDASDEALWVVLERVKLAAFLRSEQGLNTQLQEKGSNFSGGQCQRLALARAILQDSGVYIFDEATSNIDVESENDILAEIHALAKRKTVVMISHRLANVVAADNIYVLDHGNVTESGTHGALLEKQGQYARLWEAQQALEHYGEKKEAAV